MLQPLARLCVGSDCSIGRIAISPATASRGHRRWQTMHNRWWSEAQPAGNGYLTIIRRRRCRTNLSIKERPLRTYMHLLHLRETCRAYCHTPLQTRRSIIYSHLITSDINRASGYNLHNPTLAPQATMWGQPNTPQHQQPRSGCRPNNIRSQNPQNHKNLINLSEFNHLSAFSAPLCEKITAPMVPSVLPYSPTSFYAGD